MRAKSASSLMFPTCAWWGSIPGASMVQALGITQVSNSAALRLQNVSKNLGLLDHGALLFGSFGDAVGDGGGCSSALIARSNAAGDRCM
jgi:hypothetical protein